MIQIAAMLFTIKSTTTRHLRFKLPLKKQQQRKKRKKDSRSKWLVWQQVLPLKKPIAFDLKRKLVWLELPLKKLIAFDLKKQLLSIIGNKRWLIGSRKPRDAKIMQID